MKKKQLFFIITILCILLIPYEGFAVITAKKGTRHTSGLYGYYDFSIYDNGQLISSSAKGYCMDAGNSVPPTLVCSSSFSGTASGAGAMNIMQQLSTAPNPGIDAGDWEKAKNAAIRMAGVAEQINDSDYTDDAGSEPIMQWQCWLYQEGRFPAGQQIQGENPATKCVSMGKNSTGYWKYAVDLYGSVYSQNTSSPGTSGGAGGVEGAIATNGGLTFELVSQTETTAVVKVTSSTQIDDIEFKSEGDSVSVTGGGTSWTVTITDGNDDCEFDLKAYFCVSEGNSANGTTFYCHDPNQKSCPLDKMTKKQYEACIKSLPQTFIVTVEDENICTADDGSGVKSTLTTTTASAEFKGKFKCDKKCSEPGVSVECGQVDKEDNDGELFVNCCNEEEGYVSYYKQVRLNEIFCDVISEKEKRLGLENWDPKCGAKPNYGTDRFEELKIGDKTLNVCQEFCSEKLGLEIPGQIDGEAGMYFKLKSIDHIFSNATELGFHPQREAYKGDIYSPYIIGVKRCRTVINYEDWRNIYVEFAEAAKDNFNNYQREKAKLNVLNDVNNNKTTGSHTPTMTCKPSSSSISRSCTKTAADGTKTSIDDPSPQSVSEITLPADGSRKSFTYKKYNFTGKNINYYQIERYIGGNINDNNFSTNNDTSRYFGIDYRVKGTENTGYAEGEWYDEEDIDAIIKYLNGLTKPSDTKYGGTDNPQNLSDGSGTYECNEASVSYSCTFDSETNRLNERTFDMSGELSDRTRLSGEYSRAYAATVTNINTLETELDKCDEVYNELGYGKLDDEAAKKEYDWESKNPDIAFKYAQVYYDQTGTVVFDASEFKFREPDDEKICVVYRKEWNGEDEDQWYNFEYKPLVSTNSTKVGTGDELLKSFGGTLTEIIKSAGEFNNFRNGEGYEATKVWGHDMAIQAECYWAPSDKPWQTLYPNAGDGISSSSVRVEEMPGDTGHYKVITTYMSVWEGSYETAWFIQGLGREGTKAYDFEKKFNEESSETCSLQKPQTIIDDASKTGGVEGASGATMTPSTVFTCKALVKKPLTQTEGCPPKTQNGVSVGINYTSAQAREACCGGSDPEACPTVEPVLKSSIVDPTVICPTGTDCTNQFDNFKNSSGDWNGAYNEIRETAIADKTYAPENVSYTATLTPSTIREIKGEKGSYGTTKDSGFNCKTPSDNIVEGTETVVAAGECTSTFVTKYTDNATEARSSGNVHSAWYGRYEIG